MSWKIKQKNKWSNWVRSQVILFKISALLSWLRQINLLFIDVAVWKDFFKSDFSFFLYVLLYNLTVLYSTRLHWTSVTFYKVPEKDDDV